MVIAVYFSVSQLGTQYTHSLFIRTVQSIIVMFSSLRLTEVDWKAETTYNLCHTCTIGIYSRWCGVKLTSTSKAYLIDDVRC